MSVKYEMEKKIRLAFDAWENCSTTLPYRVRRLVVQAGDIDPLYWLSFQGNSIKTYWSGRDDGMEVAGLGAAHIIQGQYKDHPEDIFERCRELLPENPGLRYFGGFAFQEEDIEKAWQTFGASRFVASRFEMIRTEGVSSFVCNLIFRRNHTLSRSEVLKQLDAIQFPEQGEALAETRISSREDFPARDRWDSMVEELLEMLRHEVMDKIVLTRKVTLKCQNPINPTGLLWHLKQVTPNGYHFCIQPEKTKAFIGATPERLIQRRDRRVQSEAVAGTRPRGHSQSEDDELAQQLLTSKKDHLEHDIVRKSIRQRLHLLCDSLQVEDSARLLRLATKQHLFSAARGKIRSGISDGNLIHQLHPTPATGGYPTENALSEIKRLEPFNRGWFAGPVGWISRDAAEFAVAIRSGLIDGAALHLYSGAGLVEGSNPHDEWEEVENKICDFLNVLKLEY